MKNKRSLLQAITILNILIGLILFIYITAISVILWPLFVSSGGIAYFIHSQRNVRQFINGQAKEAIVIINTKGYVAFIIAVSIFLFFFRSLARLSCGDNCIQNVYQTESALLLALLIVPILLLIELRITNRLLRNISQIQ